MSRMKRTANSTLCLLIVLAGLLSTACKSKKTAQKAPFRGIVSTVDTFSIEGMQVIHRFVEGDALSFKLYIKGGSSNYLKSLEGIEVLSLKAATECGTVFYSPAEIKAKLEETGAIFSTRSTLDYSEITVKCFPETFGASFDLLAQMILWPSFKPELFTELQKREINQASKKAALGINTLQNKGMEGLFSGLPYANIPSGNPESLGRLGPNESNEFFKALITRKRLAIAVVGNVSRERLEEKISLTLAELEPGFYSGKMPESPSFDAPKAITMDSEPKHGGVNCFFLAPNLVDKDRVAIELGLKLLGYRLTDRLGIPPGNKADIFFAGIEGLRIPFIRIAIKGSDAQNLGIAIKEEIEGVLEAGFSAEELCLSQKIFLTEKLLRLQTMDAQATYLAEAMLYGQGANLAGYEAKILSLSLDQVNKAFKNWFRHPQWVFAGKKGSFGLGPFQTSFGSTKK